VAALDGEWARAVDEAAAGVRRVDGAALHRHVEAAIAAGARLAHAADLVLAFALGRGDPEARRRFERELMPEIAAGVRRVDRDPAFVDELVQQVSVRLLVGDPPRIDGYHATGPLRGWVAIAGQRAALNAKRDAAPAGSPDVLAELVDREPDPELAHMKSLYRAEFRAALTASIEALSDRDRAMLRLRFVEGLELAQIGALYGVHASTVSRGLARTTAEIARDARTRLLAQIALPGSAVDSVARMVASQLDLSIARLLQ
jgi:RNA polymerase sigma-70 factor (ECF subfamily)